jgi:hypothetical protein|tara:strand:- start:44 stop:184 length:141 start_codon:yes stop_codon:yes gene_type:complete
MASAATKLNPHPAANRHEELTHVTSIRGGATRPRATATSHAICAFS